MLTHTGSASAGDVFVVLLLELVVLGALASTLLGAVQARMREGLGTVAAARRSPGELLALRFARGELDAVQFEHRLDELCRGASR